MRHIVYINRWGVIFHAVLTLRDDMEDIDFNLASRVCTSLAEARRLVELWQQEYGVNSEDIHDNSRVDLADLMKGIEPEDFSPQDN